MLKFSDRHYVFAQSLCKPHRNRITDLHSDVIVRSKEDVIDVIPWKGLQRLSKAHAELGLRFDTPFLKRLFLNQAGPANEKPAILRLDNSLAKRSERPRLYQLTASAIVSAAPIMEMMTIKTWYLLF